MHDKKLAFKSNAPFTSCILKINSTLNNNAEHLDIVMPMYSLIEYSKNYSKTTGSLWNQYRGEYMVGQKQVQIILLKIQNILIIKQKLQEDYKAAIQKKNLKLLYH